eukprot:1077492-Prorocentrum_lima.AAC.1
MGDTHAPACASPCLTLVQQVHTHAHPVRAPCDIGGDAVGGRNGAEGYVAGRHFLRCECRIQWHVTDAA